jgi:murein DD-endopeptidase / murein LD-carboxypeptidase
MKKILIALLLALPFVSHCQEVVECVETEISTKIPEENIPFYSKVIDYTKAKLGIRYGRNGFDCSGLIMKAFNSVGIELPHSSKMQSKLGEKVTKNEALPGDLIFFSSPKSKKKVGHVGIITSVSESGIQFIHAAFKGGIKYDNLATAYYMKHFLMIKRNLFTKETVQIQ